MFASLPQQPPPHPTPAAQNMFYLPSQPSPLSPRSSNIQSARPIFSMSPSPSPSPFQSKPAPLFSPVSEQNKASPTGRRNNNNNNTQTTSSYAQRYAERISNPAANISRRRSPSTGTTTTASSPASRSRQPASSVSASSTSPRDKRRDVFLNRVKRDREEGRFESRAEQILRMDYLAQRRKYEEAMARSAPNLEPVMDDEDGDGDGDEGMGGVEAEELDEYLAEAGEMSYDAWLERLDWEEERRGRNRDSRMDGGDDEMAFDEDDYDSIFMDMLSSQDAAEALQFSQSMDTSGG